MSKQGYKVSKVVANKLHNLGYDVYLSCTTGYYVDVTGIDSDTADRLLEKGYNIVDIPDDTYKVP